MIRKKETSITTIFTIHHSKIVLTMQLIVMHFNNQNLAMNMHIKYRN